MSAAIYLHAPIKLKIHTLDTIVAPFWQACFSAGRVAPEQGFSAGRVAPKLNMDVATLSTPRHSGVLSVAAMVNTVEDGILQTCLRDSLLEFRLLAHFWKRWKPNIKRDFVNNVRGVSLKNIKEGVSVAKRLEQRRGKVSDTPTQIELALQGGK